MDPEATDPDAHPRSLSAFLIARLLRLRPQHGPRPTGQWRRDPLEVPRWALTVGLLLFILLFLALLVVLFAPAIARGGTPQGINFDKPTKDWYQGPVRYIITRQEVKAYKALEGEAERGTFIDWFWQRRDIVPETPDNEFRARYEQRTFEATRKFSATTIPGWKTDMGKIYILIGPPDEVVSDTMAASHRGTVTWTYRKPPFPDMPMNTVIAFAQDPGGEFRLSTQPTLDSDVARGLQFSKNKIDYNGETVTAERDPILLNAGVSLAQTQIETMMIYGRMQQLPPREEEMFKAFVATKESYGAVIPMETAFDYYRGGEAGTFTMVTVAIKSTSVQYKTRGGKDAPDVAVFGKLVSRENLELSYPLASDTSFAESLENSSAETGDILIFQAVGAFKPGAYRAILGVEDRVSRKVASVSRDIYIPDLSQPVLSLSSITLASILEPGDYSATQAKPFQLGKFRVVPRPDMTFSKKDELNVYFQVYEPAIDPETKKPKMDVLYTFKYREADGTYKDIGTYQVKDSPAQVQGYAVPLERWPEGQYALSLTVVDQVAKKPITSETKFNIKP